MKANEVIRALVKVDFLLKKWASEMPPPSPTNLETIAYVRAEIYKMMKELHKKGTTDVTLEEGEIPQRFQNALEAIHRQIDRMSSGQNNN
jgi:hypothetical protein